MTTVSSSEDKITEFDVESLERDLRVRLPEDYRCFLLETNGGYVSGETIWLPQIESVQQTDIRLYYRVVARRYSDSIRFSYNLYCEHFPDCTIIPVASDSGGSEFVLEYEADGSSKIYFVDYYSGFNAFYLVANTFREFLAMVERSDE